MRRAARAAVARREAPNVLTLLDEALDNTSHQMVTEFACYGDLFDYIAARTPNHKRARYFFRQIAAGVQHIHACGVAHLDLSPENMLIADGRVVKIGDFGVAQYAEADTVLTADPRGRTLGKLQYRAPEIYAGGPFHAHKADVFSLAWCCSCG